MSAAITCGSCRYWSEAIARAFGDGPLEAVCLSELSPMRNQYTIARASCAQGELATHGAIDSAQGRRSYPGEPRPSSGDSDA